MLHSARDMLMIECRNDSMRIVRSEDQLCSCASVAALTTDNLMDISRHTSLSP